VLLYLLHPVAAEFKSCSLDYYVRSAIYIRVRTFLVQEYEFSAGLTTLPVVPWEGATMGGGPDQSPIFSESELTFTFAICRRPSVRLSVCLCVVCL